MARSYAVPVARTWHLLKLFCLLTDHFLKKIWYRRFKRERLYFSWTSLESYQRKRFKRLFHLQWTRAFHGGLFQMTSTMWLLMDFHSLLTGKVTPLRSLTVTPFLYVENLKTSQILQAGYIPKDCNEFRYWLWSFSRYMVGSWRNSRTNWLVTAWLSRVANRKIDIKPFNWTVQEKTTPLSS